MYAALGLKVILEAIFSREKLELPVKIPGRRT
jgi:hypothetical protein